MRDSVYPICLRVCTRTDELKTTKQKFFLKMGAFSSVHDIKKFVHTTECIRLANTTGMHWRNVQEGTSPELVFLREREGEAGLSYFTVWVRHGGKQ